MAPKRVAGLILAAGQSQRMGSPKSLLRIHERTFLEHIFSQALEAGLSDIRIVLGHKSEEIVRSLPHLAPYIICNPAYETGQLSSLVRGLDAFEGVPLDGVLVMLVDHPYVTRELIQKLVEAFSLATSPLVIPTCHGKRGHPVIFGQRLFAELREAPLNEGAAAVVRNHSHEILHLEVEEEGILIDLDTPENYGQYVRVSEKDPSGGGRHD